MNRRSFLKYVLVVSGAVAIAPRVGAAPEERRHEWTWFSPRRRIEVATPYPLITNGDVVDFMMHDGEVIRARMVEGEMRFGLYEYVFEEVKP